MCRPCNGWLDRTIEKPAKGVVRRLMPKSAGHDWPSVDSAEAAALARWLLKIGVLMRHPEAVHDQPHVDGDPDVPRYTKVPREWLDWMLSEQDPPNGFSVSAARRSLTSEAPWAGDQDRILLPGQINIGERKLEYASMSFGIRGLDVAIVWHPGWAIIHPQVENRRAAVVWPNSSGIDFGELPEVHPAECGFVIDGTVLVFPDEERFREATRTPLQAGIDPVGHMPGGDGDSCARDPGVQVGGRGVDPGQHPLPLSIPRRNSAATSKEAPT